MGTITEEQRHAVMEKSELGAKYDQQIDRESAYEHFEALREEEVKQAAEEKETAKERETAKQEKTKKTTATKKKTTSKTEKALSKATSSAMNTIGREVGKKIVRGLFGSIKW